MLENTDAELASFALNQWANHIETGSVSLSATDAARQIEAHKGSRNGLFSAKPPKVNALSENQMRLVVSLRDVSKRMLSSSPSLSPEEASRTSMSFSMWANYIETGNVGLSATDAQNIISSSSGKRGFGEPPLPKVNALSEDQMRLILRLRDLSRTFLSASSKPLRGMR